jgi:hypothetical protein
MSALKFHIIREKRAHGMKYLMEKDHQKMKTGFQHGSGA